jgi:hypothetical protein
MRDVWSLMVRRRAMMVPRSGFAAATWGADPPAVGVGAAPPEGAVVAQPAMKRNAPQRMNIRIFVNLAFIHVSSFLLVYISSQQSRARE